MESRQQTFTRKSDGSLSYMSASVSGSLDEEGEIKTISFVGTIEMDCKIIEYDEWIEVSWEDNGKRALKDTCKDPARKEKVVKKLVDYLALYAFRRREIEEEKA